MRMSRNGKKKGGNTLAWIVGIIIVLNLLENFGWIFGIAFAAIAAAVVYAIIKLIIKEINKDDSAKKDPVDVRVQGSYQPQARPQTRPAAPAQPVVEKPVQPKPSKPEPKYSPEVQAIVDEGQRAHAELEHLYATIPDLAVKAKVRELIDVSDKIIEDAKHDPSDVPQIKKFLDYYLPTTIKLLHAYDRMSSQGIAGENITGTMANIEEMLDTAVDAYKKLLDSLFANQALDVETDIQVMNTLLQREGLAGGAAGFER